MIDAADHSLILAPNATATMTVNASSKGVLTYQWMKGTTEVHDAPPRVTGATTKTLSVKLLSSADAADYTCVVSRTGTVFTAVSGTTSLAVVSLKPAILPIDSITTGAVGCPYRYQILVDDADARTPSSFTVSGLPAGLAVDAAGVVSGRPTAAVTNRVITITAKNSVGISPAETCTLTILPLPATVVGPFAARVQRHPGVADNLGARVDITPTAAGTYTAKLILNGLTVNSTGLLTTTLSMDATPVITGITGHVRFARASKSALVLDFALDAPPNTISGTLTDENSHASATVAGFRNPWSFAGTKALNYKGYYTFGLDIDGGMIGDQSVPQGNGFGTFTVADDGTLTFAGHTADNVAFTTATFAGPAGQVVVFAPAPLGSLTGTPVIVPDAINNHLDGTLSWNKNVAPAASADRAYRAGFAPVNLAIRGGKYVGPAAGAVVMGLPNRNLNAALSFSQGGLLPDQVAPLTFSIRNNTSSGITQTPVLPASGSATNPAKISFSLASKPAGQFSGGFTVPNAAPALIRTVTYQGIIIRLGNSYETAGYFLLSQLPQPGQTLSTSPQLSGQVTLEKVP